MTGMSPDRDQHRHGVASGHGTVTPVRAALLAVLFVIEILNLVGVAWFAVSLGGVPGVLVAIAAVAVMAALWGRFAAPKAGHRLRGPALAIFMLAWFAVGGLCLAAVGRPWWGLGLVAGFAAVKGLPGRLSTTVGAGPGPARRSVTPPGR
jgi:Protein of unknown function (DUF2568)